MAESIPLTAIQRATAWLGAVLSAGPLPVVEVEKLACEVGIARRTLRRSRAKLGVKSWPLGFGGAHVLGLPEHANGEIPDSAQTGPGPGHDAEAVTTAAVLPLSARDEAPPGGDRRGQPRDPAIRRVSLRRIQ